MHVSVMWVFPGYWDQCSRLLCSDCDCNLNLAGSKVDGAAGSHHICLSVVRPCKDQNSRREPVVFPGGRCKQGKALQQERAERQGMQENRVGRGWWNVSVRNNVTAYQSISQSIKQAIKESVLFFKNILSLPTTPFHWQRLIWKLSYRDIFHKTWERIQLFLLLK